MQGIVTYFSNDVGPSALKSGFAMRLKRRFTSAEGEWGGGGGARSVVYPSRIEGSRNRCRVSRVCQ